MQLPPEGRLPVVGFTGGGIPTVELNRLLTPSYWVQYLSCRESRCRA
jgi:hypothetical protein